MSPRELPGLNSIRLASLPSSVLLDVPTYVSAEPRSPSHSSAAEPCSRADPGRLRSLSPSFLGVCLAAVTVAGVLQARAMTVLRQEQLRNPHVELGGRIARDESRATLLRAAIGLLTIALLVVATMIVS